MQAHSHLLALTDALQRGLEIGDGRAMELYRLFGEGLGKGKVGRGEHEAADLAVASSRDVRLAVAVARVADDRVAQMGEVSPDLVAPAGLGLDFEQGIAGGCVAIGWIRELEGFEALVESQCFLGLLAFDAPIGVAVLGEGDVDAARLGRVATREGEVGLGDLAFLEELLPCCKGLFVQSEKQDPGCRAVEAVEGIDALADLFAKGLDGEGGLATLHRTAVYEHARRLVNGYITLIAVEDG